MWISLNGCRMARNRNMHLGVCAMKMTENLIYADKKLGHLYYRCFIWGTLLFIAFTKLIHSRKIRQHDSDELPSQPNCTTVIVRSETKFTIEVFYIQFRKCIQTRDYYYVQWRLRTPTDDVLWIRVCAFGFASTSLRQPRPDIMGAMKNWQGMRRDTYRKQNIFLASGLVDTPLHYTYMWPRVDHIQSSTKSNITFWANSELM